MCVWNTSHLLKRSIHTYANQTMDKEDYELIIIDDNSFDDVLEIIKPYQDIMNIKYIRLDHDFGMRGNTESFNTAFENAEGDILAETTPETMFAEDILFKLIYPHLELPRVFVAMKTYNLTPKIQLEIDSVDWKENIMNISKIEGWRDPWVQSNVDRPLFETHQTCSIRREVWKEINSGNGFPLFYDYGTEDPWYVGERKRLNIDNFTVKYMGLIHQWHTPFQYWMSNR